MKLSANFGTVARDICFPGRQTFQPEVNLKRLLNSKSIIHSRVLRPGSKVCSNKRLAIHLLLEDLEQIKFFLESRS